MQTPVNTEKHSKTPTALIAVLRYATPTVTWFTFGFRGVPGGSRVCGGMCPGQDYRYAGWRKGGADLDCRGLLWWIHFHKVETK